VLCISPTANWGSIPSVISYQGLLTDSGGVPVADGGHSLFFSLYDASSGGSQLWTETHASVTTQNGVFAVILGSSNPLGISFDQQLYLAIEVDGGAELDPRMPLTAAPYALAACSVGAGVAITTVNGLTDDLTLAAGSNVTITPAGNTLTIDAADPGVTGVNALSGNVTLAAGTNVTITPAGNTLTIDAVSAVGNSLDQGYDQGGAGVGRTITADNGAVHVNGSGGLQVTEGSVIFDGTTGTTPAAGAGNRLMWIPATGAFRAGAVAGVEWDDANIGGGSTVTGGADNTASGANSVVGGGNGNAASGNNATAGGGIGNTASGMSSTIAGGINNQTTAFQTAVGGGTGNIASGTASTVPGGDSNEAAGNRSFAAERRAKANHNGTFVWADDTMADFASTAADQFLIRAGGGVGIGTAAPAAQLDVQGGGVVVGAPTGGDLGACTINAEAVYDDNTLLSDYVFDYYFDGQISEEDRALHAGYRLLSLEETIEFMEREHHLPTIAGRDEWNENGRMALGTLVSQIWETVETQALYIKELKSELDELRLREQRQQQTVATQMAELRHMRHELTSELAEIRDLKTTMAGWAYGDKLEVPRETVATQREPHQREGL